MQHRTKLEDARKTIGVSVEKVCAWAERSKTTFLNADRGDSSPETVAKFKEALKHYRGERLRELTELDIEAVG
jgi:hypothetical protein